MSNPRLGILLNGTYSPPAPSWTPPAPRPSTADSLPLHSRSNSVARKIRFAPLPDPRRLDDTESDATTDDSTDTNETKKPGQLPDSQESSSASLVADLDAPASPVPSTTSGDTETPRTSKRWAAKILKPLLPRKARSSLDDGNLSPFSSGLGLPRSSSRDSTHSFSSIASGHSSKGSRRPYAANSPLKPNIPLGPPLSHSTSGQRMLNGRVYGAPRDPSPGRAGRSFEEPKFVEWGYGGMGSVQNQTLAKGGAAADWGKLQSNARTIASGDADAETTAAAEDEDDGSGMAWVRRRRAQKEKERLEKERQEREAAAAAPAAVPAAEDAAGQLDAKDDDTASTHEATSSKVADVPSISIQPAASAANSRPETPTAATLLRAPSISRNTSAASGATIKELAREAKEIDISDHTTNTVNLSAKLHAHGRAHGTPEKPARAASPSPERSSDSSATGDDDADEEDDADGDDSTVEDGGEDDVEEEDESARKTAASAGVEKLVRHHH